MLKVAKKKKKGNVNIFTNLLEMNWNELYIQNNLMHFCLTAVKKATKLIKLLV